MRGKTNSDSGEKCAMNDENYICKDRDGNHWAAYMVWLCPK